ncbi:DgyrCDS13597 [Dimorphilus gyrociliatus]|uniref:DgyrCDS13597 n=1 Tax=Dimorphilus gyrociliatus TaxID=2664684 RepID=A0A7I8WB50_9ANNE|nr:DgyrCDS13597 [Dimorphilus gyrociliatus]
MYKFAYFMFLAYISNVLMGAPRPEFSNLDLTVVVPNDKIALHFLNRNYNRKMKRPSILGFDNYDFVGSTLDRPRNGGSSSPKIPKNDQYVKEIAEALGLDIGMKENYTMDKFLRQFKHMLKKAG